jgi:hypothetical protein
MSSKAEMKTVPVGQARNTNAVVETFESLLSPRRF